MQADKNFENTDYAFKLYAQAHPNLRSELRKPQFGITTSLRRGRKIASWSSLASQGWPEEPPCVFNVMIVFLESDKNNFTMYPKSPIKARKVRLVSCSLYNSWYNLIGGEVTASGSPPMTKIPDSHYTPITLAKELAKHGYTLTTGLPHEMTFKRKRHYEYWAWGG